MPKLSFKQFIRALPVALAIVAVLWTLTVLFVLVLPSFEGATVHREDRAVVRELQQLAVRSAIAAALSGMALGALVPVAFRFAMRRRRELRDARHEIVAHG